MPWKLRSDHPDCSGTAVVRSDTGQLVKCHPDQGKAAAHLRALYANTGEAHHGTAEGEAVTLTDAGPLTVLPLAGACDGTCPGDDTWDDGDGDPGPGEDLAAAGPWDPGLHPRGQGGQFGPGTGAAPAKTRPAPTNRNPVGEGEQGDRVRQLQERLNQLGVKPRLNEDGIFGPKTLAAVRQYQQQHGLKVDGLVGPLTTAALRSKNQHPAPAGHKPATGHTAHQTGHQTAHPAKSKTKPGGSPAHRKLSDKPGSITTAQKTRVNKLLAERQVPAADAKDYRADLNSLAQSEADALIKHIEKSYKPPDARSKPAHLKLVASHVARNPNVPVKWLGGDSYRVGTGAGSRTYTFKKNSTGSYSWHQTGGQPTTTNQAAFSPGEERDSHGRWALAAGEHHLVDQALGAHMGVMSHDTGTHAEIAALRGKLRADPEAGLTRRELDLIHAALGTHLTTQRGPDASHAARLRDRVAEARRPALGHREHPEIPRFGADDYAGAGPDGPERARAPHAVVEHHPDCPARLPHAVLGADGRVLACHATRQEAQDLALHLDVADASPAPGTAPGDSPAVSPGAPAAAGGDVAGAGPHGFIHGWIKVGGGAHDNLKRGLDNNAGAGVGMHLDTAWSAHQTGDKATALRHLSAAENMVRNNGGLRNNPHLRDAISTAKTNVSKGRLAGVADDGGTGKPGDWHQDYVPYAGGWTPDLTPATGVKSLTSAGRPDGAGTADDPIDVKGNIDKALDLMRQGKNVRLNQPDEVSLIMHKIAEIGQKTKDLPPGEKPPDWDLGLLTIKGTNLFTAQHQGIPRISMPQFSGLTVEGTPAAAKAGGGGKFADMTSEFAGKLKADGIKVTPRRVLAAHLRATQTELIGSKVAGFAAAVERGVPKALKAVKEPIYVTRDNYVVDGHHRWAANIMLDSLNGVLGDDTYQNVNVIDMDIGAAIPYANAFAKDIGIAAVAAVKKAAGRILAAAQAGTATPGDLELLGQLAGLRAFPAEYRQLAGQILAEAKTYTDKAGHTFKVPPRAKPGPPLSPAEQQRAAEEYAAQLQQAIDDLRAHMATLKANGMTQDQLDVMQARLEDLLAQAKAYKPSVPKAAAAPCTASEAARLAAAELGLDGDAAGLAAEIAAWNAWAAAGFDAARAPQYHGNAEKLREYWTHGEGGTVKIRWGTDGDFNRCLEHVSKFMADPKGYCAERHHDALGIWPATHAKEDRGGKAASVGADDGDWMTWAGQAGGQGLAAAGDGEGGVRLPALVTIPGVDLLAAGTWNLSTGRQTFTPADLQAAVEAAKCPAVGSPVIKLGHLDQRFTPQAAQDAAPRDGEPAIGKVTNLAVNPAGTKLTGDLAGMPGWLAAISPSAYPRRSVEGKYRFQCQIGHLHPFVISAVALLGVTPPGVGVLSGLDDVAGLYGMNTTAASAPAGSWRTPPTDTEETAMPVSEEDVRRAYYATSGLPQSYWITELQMDPTQLIVADGDSGRLYRVPFTITGAQVGFGSPAEIAGLAGLAAARGTGPLVAYASAAESRSVIWAAWDGSAAVSAMGDDPGAGALKAMFALPGDTKSASKLPHHDVSGGKVSAANPDACSAAIAALNGGRGGMTGVSPAQKKAAYTHLAAHLRAAGREPPDFTGSDDTTGPGPEEEPGSFMTGGIEAARKPAPSSEDPARPSSENPADTASSDSPAKGLTHGSFSGEHSHPHAAMGAQGSDTTHEHMHSHDGDGSHDHQHGASAAASPSSENPGQPSSENPAGQSSDNAPGHGPFTGTHTHDHPDYGGTNAAARGGPSSEADRAGPGDSSEQPGMHSHPHSHSGDANHDHHTSNAAAGAAASTETGGGSDVEFTTEQWAAIRRRLGKNDGEPVTPAEIAAAIDVPRAPTVAAAAGGTVSEDGQVAVPQIADGTYLVDAEILRGYQERARAGDRAVHAMHVGERDVILAAAVKEGKFAQARVDYFSRLWDKDPEGTRKLVASLASGLVPVVPSGSNGEFTGDPDLPGEFEAQKAYKDLYPEDFARAERQGGGRR